ncbi:MAG: hypothetical protein ACT4NY_29000 [Pseudonocardiales bacterium]
MDIDTTLVEHARHNLDRAGYTPTVAATDGAAGYPGGALARLTVREDHPRQRGADESRKNGVSQ